MVAERSPRGESDSRRGPPTAAEVLLPVWGDSYVRQFLRFGLPPLLAPGNLPSVARTLPTRFVLLTSERDEPTVRCHKAFRELSELVQTECRPIDHLISSGNHSTTVTIAFAEAIARHGTDSVGTCFFLLTSDYLMANESLANVLARMRKGASAVLAGNFQVTRELALPALTRLIKFAGSYQPTSRQLMRFGLRYLHPATLANVVNVPINHNAHTNRLFWRIDRSALLGRFYLMHPVCIRPERSSFVIGSSLDYSFVPEMCPSGQVDVICDSDEYLVVEVQPQAHESDHLRVGPFRPDRLAHSLSEWTTAQHRANASHRLLFHAGDPPDGLAPIASESDLFVDEVARRLTRKPQPHRGHRYWRGAVTAFYGSHRATASSVRYPYVQGLPRTRLSPGAMRAWAKSLLIGTGLDVRPWERDWTSLRPLKREVRRLLSRPTASVIHAANYPTACGVWLADQSANRDGFFFQGMCLNELVTAHEPVPYGSVDLCLLEALHIDAARLSAVLHALLPVLRPGGRVVVSVEFSHGEAEHLALLDEPGLRVVSRHFISRHPLEHASQRILRRVYHLTLSQPWFGLPLAITTGPFALCVASLGNVAAARRATRPRGMANCSQYVLVLEKTNGPDGGTISRAGGAYAPLAPEAAHVSRMLP